MVIEVKYKPCVAQTDGCIGKGEPTEGLTECVEDFDHLHEDCVLWAIEKFRWNNCSFGRCQLVETEDDSTI